MSHLTAGDQQHAHLLLLLALQAWHGWLPWQQYCYS
jgi:hypothetical protein